jgi:two-component system, sensor histidine kinase YesM
MAKTEKGALLSRLLGRSNSRLQRRIFFYFLAFSLTITFVGFLIISHFFLNTYIPSEKNHAVNSANKAKQSIEFILNITNNTASLLASNSRLLDALMQVNSTDTAEYDTWKAEIDLMLKNMITIHEFIDNIYVLGTDGEFFSSYWDANQREIETRFADPINNLKSRQEYLEGIPIVSYIPFFDLNVISYTRPIFQYPDGLSPGMLVFDLNYTYLREVFTFSSLQQDDEKLLIIDKSGQTIFTFPFNTRFDFILEEFPVLREENTEVEGKIFGRDSFIISSSVAYSDWTVIRIISKDSINQTVDSMTRVGKGILIIFIILAFIISFMLSVSITRPVIRLNNTITKVDKGNMGIRADGEGPDEIGQLATSFNHMIERISDLMEKTLDEQKKKSDLEFQILQSQINPHFLYNTLDSIKWLAVFQNVENISDMVSSLINLLKYNISRKSKLVPLSDEIGCIKDYIEIQKFRFGDAFDIVYDLGEGTAEKYILKFILQPLVENAIFHGFDSIDYTGVVTIRSRLDGDQLHIDVIDNGRGFDEGLGGQKMAAFSYDKKKMHSSIGVANVHDRIKLYFGEGAELSITNGAEQGVVVHIVLPVMDDASRFADEGRGFGQNLDMEPDLDEHL